MLPCPSIGGKLKGIVSVEESTDDVPMDPGSSSKSIIAARAPAAGGVGSDGLNHAVRARCGESKSARLSTGNGVVVERCFVPSTGRVHESPRSVHLARQHGHGHRSGTRPRSAGHKHTLQQRGRGRPNSTIFCRFFPSPSARQLEPEYQNGKVDFAVANL